MFKKASQIPCNTITTNVIGQIHYYQHLCKTAPNQFKNIELLRIQQNYKESYYIYKKNNLYKI